MSGPDFHVKTIRFSNLVQAAGRPEPHLLLMDPEKDSALKAAMKKERVMTLFQQTVGNAAEHGIVGFEKGAARQYLIFPKSLHRFAGKRIIGIKYDLLESGPVPKSQRAPKPHAPKKKDPKKKMRADKDDPPEPRNIVRFPEIKSHAGEPTDEETREVTELKKQVKRAMDALEKGKQVAAFNLLKQIMQE